MAGRDTRGVASLIEPPGDAPGKPVIALAVGGAEIPFELGKLVADTDHYLAANQPVPRAQRNLAQPFVEAQRRGVPEALGDDLGGPPRPADRAGDDLGAGGLGQREEAMPDRLGLRNAALGQRRVAPTLIPPRAVPFGLAVADEEDRHRRMR